MSFVLEKVDLSNVNLMKNGFSTELSFQLNQLKQNYKQYWNEIFVQTTVCDDYNNTGKCSDGKQGSCILSVGTTLLYVESHPQLLERRCVERSALSARQ